MKLLLMIVVCALGLSGCFSTPHVRPVLVNKNILISPEAHMLEDCVLSEPPDTALYLGSTWTVREDILMKNIQAHSNSVILCNIRWKNLREWKTKQEKIFNQQNQ